MNHGCAIATFAVVGLLMTSCQSAPATALSATKLDAIQEQVKHAAVDHLHARDMPTALSHYADDAMASTNGILFRSLEALAEDIQNYYDSLKEVNLAVWDEMYIDVLGADLAFVTATCRYSFTNINNERTDLKGVWSALYVRVEGEWKIRVRHESFSPVVGS